MKIYALFHRATITSGQSNLTVGRVVAAHGRFTGIRQVAPVCTPPNTCFLWLTRVQIPNGISIGSAVFVQLTVEPLYTLQWAALSPQNCPCLGGSGPDLIHASLGLPESSIETVFRSVHLFCRAQYCDRQTHRQIDRPRYLVYNNRPHLRT